MHPLEAVNNFRGMFKWVVHHVVIYVRQQIYDVLIPEQVSTIREHGYAYSRTF